jgi:DNA-binding PadR family transcriptional regulator
MDYTCRSYWNAVLNASLCKFLILRVVCEQPMHGYGIIARLAELTRNLCVPTQGTVYPVLREFEKCGCVRSRIEVVHGRERKVYTATSRGQAASRAGMDVWRRAIDHLQVVVGQPTRASARDGALMFEVSPAPGPKTSSVRRNDKPRERP